MRSDFLKNFKFEVHGKSHSSSIGATLYNLPYEFKIDIDKIEQLLKKRNPNTFFNTLRKDSPKIYFTGLKDGVVLNKEISFELQNDDKKSSDYQKNLFRLNHADYVSYKKFGKDYPYEGGGPFSGRMTALIVVIGEIARQILEFNEINYQVFSQVLEIKDEKFTSILSYDENYIFNNLDEEYMVLEENKEALKNLLEEAIKKNDTLGALVETKISSLNLNLGDIFFESFESKLAHAIFSIPGIKGINFGASEDYYKKSGEDLLEDFIIKDNKIVPLTNVSGGINGGITNGYQDVYFKTIIKPPMSLNKEINLLEIKDYKLKKVHKKFGSRHDTFIANKAIYAINAWVHIIILDFVLENDIIIKKESNE